MRSVTGATGTWVVIDGPGLHHLRLAGQLLHLQLLLHVRLRVRFKLTIWGRLGRLGGAREKLIALEVSCDYCWLHKLVKIVIHNRPHSDSALFVP